MKYIGKYLSGEILLLKYTSCKSAYRKVNFVTLYKLIPVLSMRTKTFRELKHLENKLFLITAFVFS